MHLIQMELKEEKRMHKERIFRITAAFSLVLVLFACLGGQDTANAENADETAVLSDAETGGSSILVAYFSATGHTEAIAQMLSEGMNADLYQIVPEQIYTEEDLDYGDPNSRTSLEMDDPDCRPAIAGSAEDMEEQMEQYDVVLLGYPIWWGEAPRIMSTFMESYDFSGKTVAAFCTSSSSGFGNSDEALKDAAPDANWLDGKRFSSEASAEEVMEWANGLSLGEE